MPTHLTRQSDYAKLLGMSIYGYDPDQNDDDAMVIDCETNHDRRDAECSHCDVRAELQHCSECGADFVDGKWWTGLGTTRPNGCDHAALIDDWGYDVICEAYERIDVSTVSDVPGSVHINGAQCRDLVTTAGRTRCDHHQRLVDQLECGRVYQALVASPPAVTLRVVS